MTKTKLLKDRIQWEAFLAEMRPPTFLQSWAWGETQRALGEDVIRLAAVDGETILGVAQAVTVTARRGKFLHVPHGPLVNGRRETTTALLTALRDEAKRRGLAFLRVSPIQEDTPDNRALYASLGFRPAPIYLHAENLWVLDITPSEDAMLAAMRKTTRNLIRSGERMGVAVRLSSDQRDLEPFFALYRETAQREAFVPFPERLITEEVRGFGLVDVRIGIAAVGAIPLAAAVMVLTPWSAFYHHGASTRAHNNAHASYALQWALIGEARRHGCASYNFWGIYPKGNARYGITTFKTGFGGREVALVPTQDLPLSPGYWTAYALDRYRKWRRGI